MVRIDHIYSMKLSFHVFDIIVASHVTCYTLDRFLCRSVTAAHVSCLVKNLEFWQHYRLHIEFLYRVVKKITFGKKGREIPENKCDIRGV